MDLPMIGGPFDGGVHEPDDGDWHPLSLWYQVDDAWAVYARRSDRFEFVGWE